MTTIPFYDPKLSYEDNYHQGPFGLFAEINLAQSIINNQPLQTFLGLPVASTFGIPAGPLLNSKFIQAAFNHGFDLCTYKTVRSSFHPCHPLPNTMAVKTNKRLMLDSTVIADAMTDAPIAITNSFGVPSMDPSIWQNDMELAVKAAQIGQVMIASFQGSGKDETQIKDYFHTAHLVLETGAAVLEANLSCPNEGHAGLLCFDLDKTKAIVQGLRKIVHDRPLLIKLAYFENTALLSLIINGLGDLVDGFCAINTIPAKVIMQNGEAALPNRSHSGICGAPIRWAGLKMVAQLAVLRAAYQQKFAIIANGGVMNKDDEQAYRLAGADAVMSATAAMWNPNLAKEIKQETK